MPACPAGRRCGHTRWWACRRRPGRPTARNGSRGRAASPGGPGTSGRLARRDRPPSAPSGSDGRSSRPGGRRSGPGRGRPEPAGTARRRSCRPRTAASARRPGRSGRRAAARARTAAAAVGTATPSRTSAASGAARRTALRNRARAAPPPGARASGRARRICASILRSSVSSSFASAASCSSVARATKVEVIAAVMIARKAIPWSMTIAAMILPTTSTGVTSP